MSENAEIIKKFLNDKSNNIIYGINIDEQKSIFYQAFVKTILSLNGTLLKKVDDIKDINEGSVNLFESKNTFYISFKKLKYTGKEKLINFLPYKDVKKYLNNGLINAYEIDKDIKFLLKTNNLDNESELFEYLKLNPHMAQSEIEKFLTNKKNVIFDNYHKSQEDIYFIRKEIFKTKNNGFDLKKILDLLKKEAMLKKFNFLTY